MKVVHISYLYGEKNTGGAAIAATRLHKALLKDGFESYFICTYKHEDGTNVIELPKSAIGRQIRKVIWKSLRVFFGLITFQRALETNLMPLVGLLELLDKIKPDVVHVHWFNLGSLSFEQLAKIKYPVVLNLHDMFIINALDPYPGNDERYVKGYFRQNSTWWERWLFNRKRKAVESLQPVFVGPSDWVCKCALKSIVAKESRCHTVSNIIEGFSYEKREPLSGRKFRIAFGANGGTRNKYKGFDDLLKSINFLPINIRNNSILCVYGENAEPFYIKGLKVEFHGALLPAQLENLLNSCDLFVFPSKEETQGMTKIEAMLCGLPVVAFDRTACAEGICQYDTGWIAKDGDWQGYADGIEYFYNLYESDKLVTMKERIAKYAKEKYSSSKIAKSMLEIYTSAVGKT